MLGLYLAAPAARRPVAHLPPRRLMLAGLSLGLAFLLRLHLLPAIALIAIVIYGTDLRRRWLPLVGGGAVVLLVYGLLDIVTLGRPWQSIWLFLWVNIVLGISAGSGPEHWSAYVSALGAGSSYALAIFALAWHAGAKRAPLLLAIPLTILATLSLLSHKEYRYLYPALPLLMTLAGIGFAVRVPPLLAGWGITLSPPRLGLAGAALWIGLSLTLAHAGRLSGVWMQNVGVTRAMETVAQDPTACAVAIYPAAAWFAAAGRAALRPDQTLKAFSPGDPAQVTRGFNAIVTDAAPDFSPLGFRREACWAGNWSVTPGELWDTVCLWRRAGGCEAGVAPDLQATPPVWLQERLRKLDPATPPGK